MRVILPLQRKESRAVYITYENGKIVNTPDRSDTFLSHVYHICKSEKVQNLLKIFRLRTVYYDMDKDWRFYRVPSFISTPF